MEMFNRHYQWLLIVDEHSDKVSSTSNMSIVKLLSALNISISTQIVLFRTTFDAIFLFDVWYSNFHGSKLFVTIFYSLLGTHRTIMVAN